MRYLIRRIRETSASYPAEERAEREALEAERTNRRAILNGCPRAMR